MIYFLDFTDKAKKDISHFRKSGDRIILKKLKKLLDEISEDPFKGSGKPEKLKYELAGFWSRRINREHRLVYEVLEDAVVIHSLRGHY